MYAAAVVAFTDWCVVVQTMGTNSVTEGFFISPLVEYYKNY